jgi:FixJ family two-component response regulator
MRKAVGRLLALAGFEVRAFASADDFLDAPAEPRADCLLVDVHLGTASGFDLVERLRAQGRADAVVFMTAHDSEHTRARAETFGSRNYLQKPFEEGSLLEAVNAAIAAAR